MPAECPGLRAASKEIKIYAGSPVRSHLFKNLRVKYKPKNRNLSRITRKNTGLAELTGKAKTKGLKTFSRITRKKTGCVKPTGKVAAGDPKPLAGLPVKSQVLQSLRVKRRWEVQNP